MTAVTLEPTVTAPDFGTDPLAYYHWHLSTHPEMYVAFRRQADLYRAPDPGRRFSADMICHALRFQSGLSAAGDLYQVNNNVTPLYARLYRHERPGAAVAVRGSMLDALDPAEWAALLALVPKDPRAS